MKVKFIPAALALSLSAGVLCAQTAWTGATVSNTGGPVALNGQFVLQADQILSGTSVFLLNGDTSSPNYTQIGTNGSGWTLFNQTTLQGGGLIGSNAGADYQNLSLNNSGTIDAYAATLLIQGTGTSITNSGLFEATSGGTLTVATQAAVNNQGGTILAATGSTVNLSGTIQGGTLTTQGTGVMQTSGSVHLDAQTQGPITLTDGSTYTAGAAASNTQTFITGQLNLGTASGSTVALGGALELTGNTTVTAAGTGSITMSQAQIGTNGSDFTLTNNALIQGSGLIGSNATTYQNLSLQNNGTINANTGTLTIAGTGGSVVNAGTFEATSGGTLNVATAAAVNNQAGTILAGTGSTVNLSGTIQGGTLTTQGTGVMQTSGAVTLDASNRGAITLTDGSTYTAGAAGTGTQTFITGQLNLGTTSGSTLALGGALELTGDTTITAAGTGSITMNQAQIGTNGSDYTLTNNVLIQGSGLIGSNATTYQNLSLLNNATIDSNTGTLTLQGTGGSIVNAGTFEATSGGTLNVATQAAVNNQAGTIFAGTGSTVNLSGTIQGGTLTTQGTGVMQTAGSVNLDAASLGAITLTDGSTFTAGAAGSGTPTGIIGQLNLGTTSGSTFALGGALELKGNTTVTAAGTGSITLNQGLIGTNGSDYTLTNNALIQGSGVIGSNTGADYQNLSLLNNGTINSNAGTLSIQGTGGSIVNASLFEATGSGSVLDVTTQAAVNNQTGTILAGDGTTVNLTGTIQGGLLTTLGTGIMQTAGSVNLDAATLGAITLTDGSTYTAGAAGSGTPTGIIGQLNLGTTSGSTFALGGALELKGNTTVTAAGTGSITLNQGLIGSNGADYTLTNNALIQGSGVIGSNVGADYQDLSLQNNRTINSNAGTLSIQGTGGSIVNAGLFEATGSGSVLDVTTQAAVNNQTGTILAGDGTTVNLTGTIQGGLLTTQGTGIMQTSGSVTLDANAKGAITLTDGSTYTAGAAGSGTITAITGQLNLGTASNLALGGALELVGDTTITGSAGSITLNSGQIGTNGSPLTLTNDTLIQGSGTIGSNDATYQNLNVTNAGTIEANVAGQALKIAGTGTLTNDTGVLIANTGSSLNVTSAFANFTGGNTLTGGVYDANGGTVSLNLVPIAGPQAGGEIINNTAEIDLIGATAKVTDLNGNNALSNLALNQGAASVLNIQSGAALQISGNFTNQGAVTIIFDSSLTTGASGADTYTQAAGSTEIQGTGSILSAATVDITGGIIQVDGGGTLDPAAIDIGVGGTLAGSGGFIDGDVTNDGLVVLGDAADGDPNGLGHLTENGDFTQNSDGTLFDGIDLSSPGVLFADGLFTVNGNVTLGGTLNIDLDPFTPSDPLPSYEEIFDLINYTGIETGAFSAITGLDSTYWEVLYNPEGNHQVDLEWLGSAPPPPPPPPPPGVPDGASTGLLLGLSILGMALAVRRIQVAA